MQGYRHGLKEREEELGPLHPVRTSYRELLTEETIGLHYHHALEVNWFQGAQASVRISGRTWNLEPDAILVVPPQAPHSYQILPGGSVWVVQISLEGFQSLFQPQHRAGLGLESLDWVASVPPIHFSYQNLVERVAELARISKNPSGPSGGALDTAGPLGGILSVLRAVDRVAPDDLKTNDPMRRIIEFSEAHWQQPITLKAVAEAAYLSVPHLCRVFKAASGTSYIDYLSRLRIEKACQLLRTGMPVTDVCFESGFQNLSYFIQVFRRYVGQTPGVFKNLALPTG